MKKTGQKATHTLWTAAACCWILLSCEKPKEITVAPRTVAFESSPAEAASIDVSTSVNWAAAVDAQANEWLTVAPMQGKGNTTVTLTATENTSFDERTARIVFEGDGAKPDTVRIFQEAGLDVVEKIEDEIFRTYCLNEFDLAPKDGKLSLTEVREVTEINVRRMKIVSLVGIEYFTKLKDLNCEDNEIAQLDVSRNTELTTLNCRYNLLTQLNTGGNQKLTELNCTSNLLESLDVTQTTALIHLECSINQLTSLNVSNNTALATLYCDQNQLTALDVSQNTQLGLLSCLTNRLSTLDVRNNTLITQLWCGDNLFTSIDLSQNTTLNDLRCTYSRLLMLDLSSNIALAKLYCSNSTQLASLNLTKNTQLTDLYSSTTSLSGSIDLSQNTKLNRLELVNNRLTTIYVWKGFAKESPDYKKDDDATYIER
jgi:hypothetical protein